MASLIYNGVSIDIVKTHNVAFTPILDVDNTYLYTKVSIAISGLINPEATSHVAQSGEAIAFPGSTPTASVQAIRHRLLQPRGPLLYDSGGSPNNPLVQSPGPGMPCDPNNGPVPGNLTITRVDGTKTYHVNYAIETWIIECPAGTEPSPLLSNRYAQSHSVDALHYTTITTTGQALFRTDLLEAAGVSADRFRPFVLPPVPGGFQRKAIDIALTPARNGLTYRVVDQEKPFDLSNRHGVVECKATYEVSSTGTQDGGVVSMMTLHRVQIQVAGNKSSSNWELLKFSVALARARLPIGENDKGFVRQVAVTQSLTDRSVGLVVVMMLFPKKAGPLGAIDADALRFDQPFPDQNGANPNMPNRKGAAGTYANELLAGAWKSACQGPALTSEGAYVPGDPVPYESPGSPQVRVGFTEELPDFQTHYSDETCFRPYTEYRITTDHQRITSTMQVPLAGPAGEAEYVSGGGSGGGSGDEAELQAMAEGDEPDESPDCAFLTLARPMHRRIVRWSAERVGRMPEVPSPNTSDPNARLIDTASVVTEAPSLLPDGETMCYRASGTYTFGLKRAPKKEEGLMMGTMPWITAPYEPNSLPDMAFVNGIIDQPADSPNPYPGGGTP